MFSDGTLFRGVTLLPPGYMLRVSADGSCHRTQYWDFHFAGKETNASEGEIAEELQRLFEQSVRRQVMSDVPIGAFLSGGMDSGAITAVAAKEIPYRAPSQPALI